MPVEQGFLEAVKWFAESLRGLKKKTKLSSQDMCKRHTLEMGCQRLAGAAMPVFPGEIAKKVSSSMLLLLQFP